MKVLVVGGGTMGLACTWALSRRGISVVCHERFGHVHGMGSHGGFTRIIRHAYHEGTDYVRLVDEAEAAWLALSRRAGHELLRRTGLLEFGPSDDAEFSVARQALAVHGIEHEHAVDPAPFRIPSEWQTCSTPRSGYLRVAACLGAFRHEAEAAGARIVNDSRVREVVRCGERPGIVHESGETEWADAVVVATGAYAPTLLPGFVARHPIEARRRVLVWLDPPADAAPLLAAMPCWAAFAPEGFFYGFPFADEGVRGLKLACHHRQGNVDGPVTAETVDREIHDRDLAPVLEFVREHLPIAGTKVVHATVCMYAMTRSGDFLIDVDEDDPRVLVVGGFSGHGFKFAPVIGEMAADLLERGESARRLDCFTRDHHLC